MPTQAQIEAASDAWEAEARKWTIREGPPWWLVEPNVETVVPVAEMATDVYFHKFSSKGAAQMFVRHKIIRAILTAAENG